VEYLYIDNLWGVLFKNYEKINVNKNVRHFTSVSTQCDAAVRVYSRIACECSLLWWQYK